MFRKKDTDAEIPASGEGAFRRSSGEASKSTLQPDFTRRKVELSPGSPGAAGSAPAGGAGETAAGQPTAQLDPDRYGKCLIVGEGIRLSGEIS